MQPHRPPDATPTGKARRAVRDCALTWACESGPRFPGAVRFKVSSPTYDAHCTMAKCRNLIESALNPQLPVIVVQVIGATAAFPHATLPTLLNPLLGSSFSDVVHRVGQSCKSVRSTTSDSGSRRVDEDNSCTERASAPSRPRDRPRAEAPDAGQTLEGRLRCQFINKGRVDPANPSSR